MPNAPEGISESVGSRVAASVRWCAPSFPIYVLRTDFSSGQTPNQVYIDVESHEMVDVIDAKSCYPHETAMRNPAYSEKSGKLSAANPVIRAL